MERKELVAAAATKLKEMNAEQFVSAFQSRGWNLSNNQTPESALQIFVSWCENDSFTPEEFRLSSELLKIIAES